MRVETRKFSADPSWQEPKYILATGPDALRSRDSRQDFPLLESGKDLIVCPQNFALNENVIGANYSRGHSPDRKAHEPLDTSYKPR